MDIDAELEKLVAGLMPVPQGALPVSVKRATSVSDIKLLPHILAALLRARKALREGITTKRHTHGRKEVYLGSRNHLDGCPTCRYVLAAPDAPLRAALADTELEEALQ